MRMYNSHPVVEMDFAKALLNSKSRQLKYDAVEILIDPSLHQAVNWMETALKKEIISFDIETVGEHVRSLAFAYKEGITTKAISIPFMKFASSSMAKIGDNIISVGTHSTDVSSYWTIEGERTILDNVAKIFESKSIMKVGHNSICFDAPRIKNDFCISIENHSFDTIHAWHLLYSELNRSLKFVTTLLLNYPNYWTDKTTSDDKEEWTYNAYDAAATIDIYFKINDEIVKKKMTDKYKEINKLAIAISRIQERGIKIDEVARKKIKEEQIKELKIIKDKIKDIAGEALNPNSPKQVKELLYDKMKFPTVYDKKKPTTNEVALKKLAIKFPNEKILKLIIKYRKITKLISSFLDMKIDDDGRMRTSYDVSGTKNGRLSSSKTLRGTGGNLQNIPVGKRKGIENIRNIFIPSNSNKILLRADLSQAEALVVGDILTRYGDNTLANLHKEKDFDVHLWTAAQIFNKSMDTINKHERDVGKLANHSGNYVAGPGVLVNRAIKDEINGIDYGTAKTILDRRHRSIPGLKKWWRDVEKTLLKYRKIKTCLGRERIFFGRIDNTTLRDAVAFEPQSIVADVTNMILTRLEMDDSCKMSILLQVHDEIVGELYEKDLDSVIGKIKDAIKIPLIINPNRSPLIIPIDIEVGENWRNTKKCEN